MCLETTAIRQEFGTVKASSHLKLPNIIKGILLANL